jgi:hypothetical protein
MPCFPLGCRYERLELVFLIALSFEQSTRVVAKIGNLFGSKPERHSSRSCAAAIRGRKLGG